MDYGKENEPAKPSGLKLTGRSLSKREVAARRRAARKQRAMGPLERKSVKGTTASERKALRTESPEKTISRAVSGDKPVTPALAKQVLSNLAIIGRANLYSTNRGQRRQRVDNDPQLSSAMSFFNKSFLVAPTGRVRIDRDRSFQEANAAKLKSAAEAFLKTSDRSGVAKKKVN